jgi:uncharacterized protein DUF5989
LNRRFSGQQGNAQRELFMGFLGTTSHRFGIAGELFSFFWSNKRRWMVPILVSLLLFGVLLIFAESSAIAPFIYSMF